MLGLCYTFDMGISSKKQTGFTLVELLIVIVIIGILASISVVAYTGIQQRAHNVAQLSDMKNVITAMELYGISNGQYPPAPASSDGGFCVGTGYPGGYCGDSSYSPHAYPESDRTITDALATIASAPSHQRRQISGHSGPYVQVFSSNLYWVVGVFHGETCEQYAEGWNDPDSDRILCYKELSL